MCTSLFLSGLDEFSAPEDQLDETCREIDLNGDIINKSEEEGE